MRYYETVSEAVNDLQTRGYKLNFNLKGNCLHCVDNELQLYPEDFHIDEVYRFEGQSDPADEAVVYAVSSDKHAARGVLVDGYGASAEAVSPEIRGKLQRY